MKNSENEPHKKILEKFSTPQLWYPKSTEQMFAYMSPADELFYGGQAGGGKTDLLLGVAATDHWRSIIFRRIFPNLEGIIYRGNQIFPAKTWSGYFDRWKHNGRIVQLGAMQYDDDKTKYQGRPYDLMAFDEICEFLQSQYEFVTAWNRTTTKDQRSRIICTGNPPTDQDGAWVIDYWAPWLDRRHPNPAEPNELRWFVTMNGRNIEVDGPEPIEEKGEKITPSSRTFIPAKMISFLRDTNYEKRLHGLPEPLRSQLLYGDFSVGQEDDEWQIIPTEWVLLAMERWRLTHIPKVVDNMGNVIDQPMDYAGVDVARGGRDYTVIAPRYGNYMDELIRFKGTDTPNGQAVAGQVVKHVQPKTTVNIDVIGVGSSPYDYLADMKVNVRPINSAEGSHAMDKTNTLRFRNLRAEMWWNAREMLDPDSGEEIALPDDKRVLRDLTTVRWKLTASGILVESKEDIIKRIGHSPDDGDSVVMSLFSKARVGVVEI